MSNSLPESSTDAPASYSISENTVSWHFDVGSSLPLVDTSEDGCSVSVDFGFYLFSCARVLILELWIKSITDCQYFIRFSAIISLLQQLQHLLLHCLNTLSSWCFSKLSYNIQIKRIMVDTDATLVEVDFVISSIGIRQICDWTWEKMAYNSRVVFSPLHDSSTH